MPLLNIAVPVNITKWETESFTPLVAIAHSSLDEKTTKLVKAYDHQGNVHWLDAQQAPDYPVVVIGLNERVEVDENGNLLEVKRYPDVSSSMMEDQIIDDGGGGGGGSTGSTTCRTDKQSEYIIGMWFADVSYYEAWVRGAPEVKTTVKSPNYNFETSNDESGIYIGTFEPPKRSNVDNNWWDLNNRLFYWDKEDIGLTTGFYFYEWDEGGDAQTIKLSLTYKLPDGSTAKAETDIKIGSSDDDIGLTAAHFDECPSQGYYSIGGGTAEFRFKLQNKL